MRQRVVAHIETCRPDLIFYAGLVSVVGALLASRDWTMWELMGAWCAPTIGWFAAMYGGDYFDRNLDAIAKSQRPIPSGRMQPWEAMAGMVTNIVLGAVIAALLNPWNLVIVVLAGALGVSYSRYLKTRGVLGNLSRGAITALAFALGTMATSPTPPLKLLPLCLVFWLHDAGSNVVGAICDQEGDREGGYRTFPVRHGEVASLWLLIAFDMSWLGIAIGWPLTLSVPFQLSAYVPLLAIAAAMGTATVVMLLRAGRPIHRLYALRAHEVLVIERLVLAAAFIAAVSTTWFAIALLLPSIAATLMASLLIMRRSYEPNRLNWRGLVTE